MSQVNFVEQFNLFMQYAQRNKLTSYERLFFLAIFHCANTLAHTADNYEWPDDFFPVNNAELAGWTGFDERAIRNARNSLKEKGLLDFEKGDGKKRDPSYRIYYLRRIGYKIAPDSTYTGCENAGGQEKTGCENAPDKETTGSKNAVDMTLDEDTDCEFAPDTVGGSVGDTVGDNPVIDCEFAPDTVGDHFIISKRKHVNVNINANITPTPTPAPAEVLGDPDFGAVMSYFMDHINPMPSSIATSALQHYTEALCADVAIHAMQICQDVRHTTWPYLRKILMRYEQQGIKTMQDVERDEKRKDAAAGAKGRRGAQEAPAGGFGLVDLDAAVEPMEGLVAGYGRRW